MMKIDPKTTDAQQAIQAFRERYAGVLEHATPKAIEAIFMAGLVAGIAIGIKQERALCIQMMKDCQALMAASVAPRH